MNYCDEKVEMKVFDSDFCNKITSSICATYEDGKGVNHIESSNLPQQSEIIRVLNDLLELIFPGYFQGELISEAFLRKSVNSLVKMSHKILKEQIYSAMKYYCSLNNCKTKTCESYANELAVKFLEQIPSLREILKKDAQAALEGDPAATSLDEVIISYPGLRTIAIYRIAHLLYEARIPLIPRVMTEFAHGETGIDIHPGAKVGEGFFIDHGTGVVIGETTIIGKNVKIYQGVTLGALSFPKDECGNIIKGKKRHPTIADNVTIYASATILGDVIIGENSVIGGNVWLMESIPENTMVTINKPTLTMKPLKK